MVQFYEQSLEQSSAAAQVRNSNTGDPTITSTSAAAAAAAAVSPPFACPLCRLGAEARFLPKPWLHCARDTFFGALLQGDNQPSSSSSSSSSNALTTVPSSTSSSSPLPLHGKGTPLSGLAAAISSAVGQSSLLSAFSGSPRSSSPRSSGKEPQLQLQQDRHGSNNSSSSGGTSNSINLNKQEDDEERARFLNGPDPPPVPDEVRWDAAALPTTGLSRFVETKVSETLTSFSSLHFVFLLFNVLFFQPYPFFFLLLFLSAAAATVMAAACWGLTFILSVVPMTGPSPPGGVRVRRSLRNRSFTGHFPDRTVFRGGASCARALSQCQQQPSSSACSCYTLVFS